jgi:hypothetical protein
VLNKGDTILFWLDDWNNTPLAESYPELFSFAKNKQTSALKTKSHPEIAELFQLPLLEEAFTQLQEVQNLVQTRALSNESDKWTITAGSDPYCTQKIYKRLVGQHDDHPVYKWIWKNRLQPKHRVFFWLLVKDRLSTKNILRRKGMDLNSYHCPLSSFITEETAQHLFIDCDFARMCWNIIGIDIPAPASFPSFSIAIKAQLRSPFFMEATILMCWTIWMARNELIFRRIGSNREDCIRMFFKEINLLHYRLRQDQHDSYNSWKQTLALLAA